MAQTVRNLPAVQETSVQSLSREDSLEKEVGGLGLHAKSDMAEQLTHTQYINKIYCILRQKERTL